MPTSPSETIDRPRQNSDAANPKEYLLNERISNMSFAEVAHECDRLNRVLTDRGTFSPTQVEEYADLGMRAAALSGQSITVSRPAEITVTVQWLLRNIETALNRQCSGREERLWLIKTLLNAVWFEFDRIASTDPGTPVMVPCSQIDLAKDRIAHRPPVAGEAYPAEMESRLLSWQRPGLFQCGLCQMRVIGDNPILLNMAAVEHLNGRHFIALTQAHAFDDFGVEVEYDPVASMVGAQPTALILHLGCVPDEIGHVADMPVAIVDPPPDMMDLVSSMEDANLGPHALTPRHESPAFPPDPNAPTPESGFFVRPYTLFGFPVVTDPALPPPHDFKIGKPIWNPSGHKEKSDE
jgi:hypothetical protein